MLLQIKSNVDKAGISSGNVYSGPAYSDAAAIDISGGTGTFSNLMHNTYYIVRIYNGSDDCYFDRTILTPTLVCPCSLTDAGETLETCTDNGTGSNPADDYITFSLNPVGTNLGATYSVTANNGGTITLAAGGAATGVSYGAATAFRLQNGSANGATNYTITVTDVADGTCTITTMVMQNACSNTCNLTDAGETLETCNDNGTNTNPSDDYITFSLNPIGTNLGATYSVTANNGGIVTLAAGGAATGVSYGAATAFRLQNGSANGATNYTITVTDVSDGTCTITTMVMQSPCSVACTFTITQNTQSTCNDNATTTVDTDDYFTIDVNATAVNGSAQYQVVMGASADGTGGTVLATSNYGTTTTIGTPTTFDADGTTTYNITVRDALDNTCHDEFTTTVVNSCNSCPSITNPSTTQTICEGQTISILSSNTDASSNIEFVYFLSPQTGNAVYTGGTNIQTVSPTAGVASISNVADFTSAGTYYVYARLSPTPVDAACRPSTEIIVTVNPSPELTLIVSDTTVCDETNGTVLIFNSEIGVIYQLRNDSNDSPVGSPIAGTGGIIELPFNNLTPVGTRTFNILASNGTTGCAGELTDKAVITIRTCDFTFPLPSCQFPACHFTSTDIYLGATVTNDDPNTGESGADDGVSYPNNIRPNITVRFPVTIYNNTGQTAYLSGWVDWNGDDDFDDAGEQIAQETYSYSAPNTGSFVVSIPVNVPSNAVQAMDLAVRWRLSSDPAISFAPCGVLSCAADGEVEDYFIQVECPPMICLPVGVTIIRN